MAMSTGVGQQLRCCPTLSTSEAQRTSIDFHQVEKKTTTTEKREGLQTLPAFSRPPRRSKRRIPPWSQFAPPWHGVAVPAPGWRSIPAGAFLLHCSLAPDTAFFSFSLFPPPPHCIREPRSLIYPPLGGTPSRVEPHQLSRSQLPTRLHQSRPRSGPLHSPLGRHFRRRKKLSLPRQRLSLPGLPLLAGRSPDGGVPP